MDHEDVGGPLVSFGTMFVASDSKAITRAMRWSCETAGLRETPFGSPPSNARERRKVVRLEGAPARAAGATAPQATAASMASRDQRRM